MAVMNAGLTKNFQLGEFLVSQTAERHGIDITPNNQVVANLTRLCCQLLQPLRQHLEAPIIITSGYRPPELNRLIGGSDRSQHLTGQAADLVVPGYSVEQVYRHLFTVSLPFDQLINEFGQWVHLSVPPANEKPRNQRLLATRKGGAVVYLSDNR